MAGWFPKHCQEVTRPFLDKVIDALKEQGVTEFAAAGYAFGARYAFDLAFDKVIKIAAVAHPTLLRIPRDFKKFKKTGIPLLLNTCGIDPVFPPESQAQADVVLGGGTQTSELYRRVHFPLCMHGFAVRGDLRDPRTKAGREGAFRATVEFFWEYF
ncbi:hypothetical protein OG21DRAFT_1329042 [Imleria badia]|nr:hypothetical protein OG21DRAFT_1329042 [Imleria badia]